VFAYEPHDLDIGGVFEFALLELSHVEFKPIIGSPPTVKFVYVTLKSVVSSQVKGSRYVPLAASGISDSDCPDRLDGEDPPPLEELEPELCFFETTIATGIIIAKRRARIPTHITIQAS
jgi:hypothetical protein